MLAMARVKETFQWTIMCGSMTWRALPQQTEIDQRAARACGAFRARDESLARVEFVTEAGSPQKYLEARGVRRAGRQQAREIARK